MPAATGAPDDLRHPFELDAVFMIWLGPRVALALRARVRRPLGARMRRPEVGAHLGPGQRPLHPRPGIADGGGSWIDNLGVQVGTCT